MPTELEIIHRALQEMQDLIEVASFYQRKLQRTDDKLCDQEKRQTKINGVLNILGE